MRVLALPRNGMPTIAPGNGMTIPIDRGRRVMRRVRAGWRDDGLGEMVLTPDGRLRLPWNPVGIAGLPTGYTGPQSLGCSCPGPQGLNGLGEFTMPEFMQGDFDIAGMKVPKWVAFAGAGVLLMGMMGSKRR